VIIGWNLGKIPGSSLEVMEIGLRRPADNLCQNDFGPNKFDNLDCGVGKYSVSTRSHPSAIDIEVLHESLMVFLIFRKLDLLRHLRWVENSELIVVEVGW
jgi:hypothetical protein